MRIAFVGAVEGSRIALEALVSAGRVPGLLLTLPGAKASRHSDHADLVPIARRAAIEVVETANVNDAATIATLRQFAPDVILVIGWSQICGTQFRNVAPRGCLGFHPAALPRFRGRGVIPWTILCDQKITGSTLFWLDDGVDSGPILLQRLFNVAAGETARTLYDKHTHNLAEMVVEAVDLLENGATGGTEQDECNASYCARRKAEDGLIDWRNAAAEIERLIRAVGDPYPGAFTYFRDRKIGIIRAVVQADAGKYIGLTGQVQAHTDAGFLVLCGDGNCLEVTNWQGEKPSVHAKL
ncbi:methionyl-tRNA formyltransferase [Ensifer adhaerens]|uniref:methionyl-tRNA formyltransferase n=1 Tax=Ensifer adhaerens TaxID=106592 RepID=UPI0008072D28|nr:methionyl-tRNA formyltransferase [Ensifer adhaerens]